MDSRGGIRGALADSSGRMVSVDAGGPSPTSANALSESGDVDRLVDPEGLLALRLPLPLFWSTWLLNDLTSLLISFKSAMTILLSLLSCDISCSNMRRMAGSSNSDSKSRLDDEPADCFCGL